LKRRKTKSREKENRGIKKDAGKSYEKNQCCGSRMFIQDPGSGFFPSWIQVSKKHRILDPQREIKYF
jgi:hypothetical protein